MSNIFTAIRLMFATFLRSQKLQGFIHGMPIFPDLQQYLTIFIGTIKVIE